MSATSSQEVTQPVWLFVARIRLAPIERVGVAHAEHAHVEVLGSLKVGGAQREMTHAMLCRPKAGASRRHEIFCRVHHLIAQLDHHVVDGDKACDALDMAGSCQERILGDPDPLGSDALNRRLESLGSFEFQAQVAEAGFARFDRDPPVFLVHPEPDTAIVRHSLKAMNVLGKLPPGLGRRRRRRHRRA